MRVFGIICAVILGLFFVGCVATCVGIGANESVKSSKVTQAVTGQEPVLDVAATVLFKAYEANEVQANKTYQNKAVRITGTIEDINGDSTSSVVSLKTSNFLMPVRCSFDDSSATTNLKKGSQVTIVGVVTGVFLGSPTVTNCIIP